MDPISTSDWCFFLHVKSMVNTDVFYQETSYELKFNIVILKLPIFPPKLPSPSNICHTISYISKVFITQAHTSLISPAWYVLVIPAAICIFLDNARLFLLPIQPGPSEVPIPLTTFCEIIRSKFVAKMKSPQSYDLGEKTVTTKLKFCLSPKLWQNTWILCQNFCSKLRHTWYQTGGGKGQLLSVEQEQLCNLK